MMGKEERENVYRSKGRDNGEWRMIEIVETLDW